ncbi:MAG: hypothetical protein Kow0019_11630 [Methanobacteriaceae archaeon]
MNKVDKWLENIEKEFEKAQKSGKASSRINELVSELRIYQSELEMQNEELRTSQEELAELYSQYHELFNESPVGYITLDIVGIITNVNANVSKLFKLDKKDIIGRSFSKFVHKADKNGFYSALSLAAKTGKIQKLELQLKRKDEILNLHMEIMPLYTMKDESYRIIITDTNKLIEKEEDFYESESKYHRLFNSIDEGFCIIEMIFDENNRPIDYRFLEINPAFEKQTGLIDAEGKLMRELRPNHEEHWFEIYGKIALTGEAKRFENPAKELGRFYDVYAFKIGGAESKKVAILFNDITERKKAEEELQIRANLLDISYEAIFSWEYDNGILSWNKGAEQLYGYNSEEVIGRSSHDLLKTKFPLKFSDFMDKLAKDKMWAGELIHLTKNGKNIIVDSRMQVIQDSSGNKIVIETNRDITGRKETEEKLKAYVNELEESTGELRRSEIESAELSRKYQDIFNTAPVGYVILNQRGIITDVNETMVQLTGFPKSHMNQGVFTLLVSSNSRDIYYRVLNNAVKTGMQTAELKLYRKDYSTFYALTKFVFNPEDKLIKLTITDITERKKSESLLKESEERFRSFYELPLIGIAITSPEKGWIEANDKICDILGYSREELFKLTWDEITYPDDIDNDLEQFNRVLDGYIDGYNLEKRFIRKDGSMVFTNISVGCIRNEDNSVKYFVVLIDDISERKKLEEKLRESRDNLELKVQERTVELDILVDELKRSNEELQQFAHVASHDLQEPLRTVASFTQLLERRYKNQLDDDAIGFMDYIVDAAKRMQQLINDLLEYSRITSQKKDFQPVDVNEVLDIALQNLKFSIDDNNAKITHNELPTIMADNSQLIQLFQNLIGNAIKFKKQDVPLKIHVSCQKDEEKNEYVFSVADNGIGIEKQYMEKIFIIFQRLHTRDVYKGTGIGLSVVKKIVERHGGRIWVESEFGVGSVFYFTLPVEPVQNGEGILKI